VILIEKLIKKNPLSLKKLLFIGLLSLIFNSNSYSQSSGVSYTFSSNETTGFLGGKSGKSSKARDIKTFSTLGISSLTISQSGNQFSGLNVDVDFVFSNGSSASFDGEIYFRIPSGGNIEAIGVIITSNNSYSLSYNSSIYEIKKDVYIGLKNPESTTPVFIDNTDVSFTTSTTNIIDWLNAQTSNTAPVAVSDTATVAEDASLTSTNVITNDTDVDGDTLTLTAVSTSGTGIVGVNVDGVSVDYTPAADF